VINLCIATGDGQFLGAALTQLRMLKSKTYAPYVDEQRANMIGGDEGLRSSEQSYQAQRTIMDDARGGAWDQTRSAIKRLLPVVSAEDYSALTPGQRGALLAFIEQPYDEELAMLVLEMLARLQETSAMQAVTRLTVNATGSARLRAGAQDCLSQLHARISEQQQHDLLLRGAVGSADTQPSDVLLRPAEGNAGPAVNELLHPSAPGDDEPRPR
jgi:hypothetical protein